MLQHDRLQELRVKHQYSFDRLAELINVSMRQLMRYENGESEPTASVIARMAAVLNVSTDYLLGRSDDPTPQFSLADLTPTERAVLAALRRNDPIAAIKAIVSDL